LSFFDLKYTPPQSPMKTKSLLVIPQHFHDAFRFRDALCKNYRQSFAQHSPKLLGKPFASLSHAFRKTLIKSLRTLLRPPSPMLSAKSCAKPSAKSPTQRPAPHPCRDAGSGASEAHGLAYIERAVSCFKWATAVSFSARPRRHHCDNMVLKFSRHDVGMF